MKVCESCYLVPHLHFSLLYFLSVSTFFWLQCIEYRTSKVIQSLIISVHYLWEFFFFVLLYLFYFFLFHLIVIVLGMVFFATSHQFIWIFIFLAMRIAKSIFFYVDIKDFFFKRIIFYLWWWLPPTWTMDILHIRQMNKVFNILNSRELFCFFSVFLYLSIGQIN